ncbi:SIR2 family NAD-dependent protein deacylase [Megasphaera sueciensis]|jgi:hypothetical protein|uniref:SIR2 family NAD-dependent protein deacylase n=1 Tax=Megasphaera sueciensis TaxID=349094 RepID=UPI003D049D32
MTNINELIEKVRQQKIILWVGAGFSLYAGAPSGNKLMKDIIKHSTGDEKTSLEECTQTLDSVAETFEQLYSRAKLLKVLEQETIIPYQNVMYHNMIRQIPQITNIVTTNYDTLFETVYQDDISVVYGNTLLPQSNNRKVKLYKIHGDFLDPQSIIITKHDYTNFFSPSRIWNPLWSTIVSLCAQHSILFIGYSLEDPNVVQLMDILKENLGNTQNINYFIGPQLPSHKQRSYEKNYKIKYIEATVEEIIPIIHKNIKRNLITDTLQKKIEYSSVSKIFQDNGIDPVFEMNQGNIYLRGIKKTTEKSLKGKIVFNTTSDDYFSDLLKGESFESFNISNSNVVELDINGINLPYSYEGSLVIQATPIKTYEGDLVFKNSELILNNVKCKIYISRSGKLKKLSIECKCLNLVYQNNIKEDSIKVSFTVPEDINFINTKMAFDFLYHWICEKNPWTFQSTDKTFSDDGEEGIGSHFSSETIEWITNAHQVYSALFAIQMHFHKCFRNPIQCLYKSDINKIHVLLSYIENKTDNITKLTARVDFMDNFKINLLYAPIPLNIDQQCNTIILFGEEFRINKTYTIYGDDVYAENLDEVIELYKQGQHNIPIVLKSKSNNLKGEWK